MAAPRLKFEMRAAALLARAGRDPAWGARLAGHVLDRCAPALGAIVSGFWPLDGEIDIRPLLLALAGRGHVIALPATPPRGQPLEFRRWRPGERLIRERFATMRPEGPVVVPDVLLVPLLAFDRRGHRLGYGGGYYDRTLAALPGRRTIGCAFAAQEVEEVPTDGHDQVLDAIATERGVLTVSRTP